jgi:hypothetical protein
MPVFFQFLDISKRKYSTKAKLGADNSPTFFHIILRPLSQFVLSLLSPPILID